MSSCLMFGRCNRGWSGSYERLKLEPIILHEQPNSGDTIIEKIDRNTDVGFGVVLSAVAVKPPTSGGGYKAT